MSVDATTQGELENVVLRWRALMYADFDGDPLRATTGAYDKVISGSGDSELDGTYISIDESVVDVSPVKHNDDGSDTVTASLGGIIVANEYLQDRAEGFVRDRHGAYVNLRESSLLNTIGDITRWQGRTARLWFYCVDEDENQVGSVIPYYTGYMNDVVIRGSPKAQMVEVAIENYILTLAGASNKTYLMQSHFDSSDNSAAATLAAANGIVEGVISGLGSPNYNSPWRDWKSGGIYGY